MSTDVYRCFLSSSQEALRSAGADRFEGRRGHRDLFEQLFSHEALRNDLKCHLNSTTLHWGSVLVLAQAPSFRHIE